LLKALLKDAVGTSFNAVTVDSDTSTSDTVLAFATGAAGNKPVARASDPSFKAFKKAFDAVCLDLALQIAKDGEGAQKLVQIDVSGAASDAAARTIAMSIGNSPLVKTAIAAADVPIMCRMRTSTRPRSTNPASSCSASARRRF
jgi:glutamate N-acetyltransferase/amino-acid N-acetyltransferase